MSNSDNHDHDHGHRPPAPMVDEVSDFEALEVAVRELCIEKGLFTQGDHNEWTEYMHTLGPLPAARLVAKAWLDDDYKQLCIDTRSRRAWKLALTGLPACPPTLALQAITVTRGFWLMPRS